MHNEASCWKVIFPKGHVPQYMISRVFIPPWSLVMRGRKLLDQTLPPSKEESRNPSFPFGTISITWY